MNAKIDWPHPQENIEVLEPTDEALWKFGYRHGPSLVLLTAEQLQKLADGWVLAWTDGEYSTFVMLKDEGESISLNHTI